MPGLFLCLDGLDGSGKSTQARLLADWLHGLCRTVVACRDPGGTPVGEQLRAIVLEAQRELTVAAETFLFMASRAELVARVIRPALDAGHDVIADRFVMSTVVYQGHAGGLDPADLWRMGAVATAGVSPDMTLILDLPAAAALSRLGANKDRMEDRRVEFHERVRAGFLAEAAARPDRCRVVDATAEPNAVRDAIRRHVQPLLDKTRG
jgi:dTMP kinase